LALFSHQPTQENYGTVPNLYVVLMLMLLLQYLDIDIDIDIDEAVATTAPPIHTTHHHKHIDDVSRVYLFVF